MSANNSKTTSPPAPTRTSTTHKARLIFGIFMVILYVAVGILCILEVFNFGNPTISLCLGILLIVYGIWRAYRLMKGLP